VNYARRGNQKDVRSRELLEADGWVVGSRRHIPGPGDLFAWKDGEVPVLIEVKACSNLWQNFRREAREELLAYCAAHHIIPLVHWWKPRARGPEVVPAEDWPS
jgi:hypothetical protein